jgi:hypothetical protein
MSLVSTALALLLVVTVTACGDAPSSDRAADADSQFTGPLYLEPGEGEHPDAGAAGDAVDCRTWGYGQSLGERTFSEGRTAETPDGAVDAAAREGFPGGFPTVETGFREAAREVDRVLYVVEVDGVIKEAVIVHHGPATRSAGGPGWYVESWATCDYAELPPAFADSLGLQLWFDESGVPAPTTHLQSWIGAEYCDWQSMTILRMDDETFVREPLPEYQKYFARAYQADTPLPTDAIDTGYARQGRHLWISPDHEQAFVGTPSSVESWPRSTEPFLCA